MSNTLIIHKQVSAIAMLCEGMGIRPTERVLGVHRDTIMRLGRDIGEGYARLHDELFVNLKPARIELDEAWSFVYKKQARLEPGDSEDYGDQYSFIGIDADKKAILAYHVGKRNGPNTMGFALDLASRVRTKPQITSDGFEPYVKAVKAAFGAGTDYAMLIKKYKTECSRPPYTDHQTPALATSMGPPSGHDHGTMTTLRGQTLATPDSLGDSTGSRTPIPRSCGTTARRWTFMWATTTYVGNMRR